MKRKLEGLRVRNAEFIFQNFPNMSEAGVVQVFRVFENTRVRLLFDVNSVLSTVLSDT